MSSILGEAAMSHVHVITLYDKNQNPVDVTVTTSTHVDDHADEPSWYRRHQSDINTALNAVRAGFAVATFMIKRRPPK